LVLELICGRLGIVGDGIGFVTLLDRCTALLIRLSELLSIRNYALDILAREAGQGGDVHRLVLASGLVLCRTIDNTIGVNVECGLDLRNALGCRGYADEVEVAEQLVVVNELTFTLVDLDLNGCLTVSSRGENLEIVVFQLMSLDTERQRSDVGKEDVGDVASKDTTLNGSTSGDGLIRVNNTLG
jgi:hypothetical protein